MRYTRVHLDSFGVQLAPVVVRSAELEERLSPVYDSLHLPAGQLEAWTGISERRFWEPNFTVSRGAAMAGRKALAASDVPPEAIDVLIYAGVCRDEFEPATACHVAAELGLRPAAALFDISNACLGVLNGIIDIANRIELGQARAGLVVSCESAREIVDVMIERMLERPDMEYFKLALATLTGGSGAVAVLVTDGSFGNDRRRLVGGVAKAAPQHHMLCRWGLEIVPANGHAGGVRPFTSTDSVAVLTHGVELGRETWAAFLDTLEWEAEDVGKVVCHQVGSAHQRTILDTLGIPEERDFATFNYLGNMGTAALPITAALAEHRGHLQAGDRVGFLGIGSGLNCMMLGWEW